MQHLSEFYDILQNIVAEELVIEELFMEMNQARNLQINFLARIEDVLPTNTSLVHEMAELLEISTDSAYRRMRGDTSLTIFEVIKLSEHFKVSFESVNSSETGAVTFSYARLGEKEGGFREFLLYLRSRLERMDKSENKYIKYVSEDVPVIYNYKYPELAAFKMFYWMKSIMNVPELEQVKFSNSVIPSDIKTIGKEIAELYSRIPSIEIWTDTTIISIVKQIEFYFESGLFATTEDFLSVCRALRTEIEDIQKQAETESKRMVENDGEWVPDKNYTLYFSDIELTNNCVLLSMGDVKNVFLGHQTFNTMDTSNVGYCQDTERWMDNIIKKSNLISGVSEKLRYQFFNKMYTAIDALIAKAN